METIKENFNKQDLKYIEKMQSWMKNLSIKTRWIYDYKKNWPREYKIYN